MTTSEFKTKFDRLPEKSKAAMRVIIQGLYAEPGFSDVDTGDVAAALGLDRKAMGGIVARLQKDGLCWADRMDSMGGPKYDLLYPSVWSYDVADAEFDGDGDTLLKVLKEIVGVDVVEVLGGDLDEVVKELDEKDRRIAELENLLDHSESRRRQLEEAIKKFGLEVGLL